MKHLKTYNESVKDFLKPKNMDQMLGERGYKKIDKSSYKILDRSFLPQHFTNDEKIKIDEFLGIVHNMDKNYHFIVYNVTNKLKIYSLILGYENIDRFCFKKLNGYILCVRLGEDERFIRNNRDEELYLISNIDSLINFIEDFNIKKQLRNN